MTGAGAVDIGAWLHGLGLAQYAPLFLDNDIDASLLVTLTEHDLRDLGIASLGHRKRLLAAIAKLAAPAEPDPAPSGPAVAPAPMSHAERRQLTVMFVDLVGSTALSAGIDPEDMREVLRSYQNAVTGGIARVNGHVAKLMGDGVLVYFGWPKAHEDDAERAVRAGLAIAEAVGRLKAPSGDPIAARVGIATGVVIVGDLVGEGAAKEEAVIGETPNLAARLQGVALPGTVTIAEGTRRLLGEVFELRELGPHQFKGFDHPVPYFQVMGERPAGSRFEAQRSGRNLPMVGRDQELALVFERWRQTAGGEGQAMLLIGEAGIGKSRLIEATVERVAGDEHVVLRYQCSPHHSGTAFWPVAQQLGRAAGMVPSDTELEKLSKIATLLQEGLEDVTDGVPLIAALLGIEEAAGYFLGNLTPKQRRDRTLAVLIDVVLGASRRRPVLLVIEDTHWSDPTTLEFIDQLLDRIATERVLMLVSSRPDNQPNLGGHPHVTRLTLNRLGRAPTDAIVSRLMASRTLPPEIVNEIAARTDGVPLFIEELTIAVLEAGTAGSRLAVPTSLHDSLMARLDRVPGVKEVAQIAACIGREFAYPLLVQVSSSIPEHELLKALERLTTAELVFARGTPPEARYTFKHALVRDAAYESLLKTRRRELHAGIARALEENFPATIETEPELLARHYTEAGLVEQAHEHWHRAGNQARARSAMAEAAAHFANGLKQIEAMPAKAERQRRELELQLALGQVLIAGKGFAAPETGHAYSRARALCLTLGDVPEHFAALYGQSVFHFQRGELSEALEVAQELLRLPHCASSGGWPTAAGTSMQHSRSMIRRETGSRQSPMPSTPASCRCRG